MTSFQARVIRGAGRGKSLGTPTLNLDRRDVPEDLEEGIHACLVKLHGKPPTDNPSTPRPIRTCPTGSSGRTSSGRTLPSTTLGASNDRTGDRKIAGVLHYGPRPFYGEPTSCEVHLLDMDLPYTPLSITVATVKWIRPVRDFPSEALLKAQIAEDIAMARAILNRCSTD